ncbi:tetratricopeptide repeat protein [Phenylobacterium sp.]|jgi:tetratricopeptide (TPR) repeat protein|uniref:tetratricopeptide repeat protein n=1 Tax=Phenylobacterium sp. TaxID=1871053 RepID=UPI002F943E5D
MRTLKVVLLASAIAIGAGSLAVAAGGGSSGGGAMPSASGPQYDPAAEYAKAVAALKAKDYKNAARAAAHVTEVVPKSVDGWRILGAAKAGTEDWKGARKAYERAVKLEPGDIVSHAGLGLALARMKDAKAQAELDWLRARAQACGDACPEAAALKSLTGQVESALAGQATVGPGAALDGSLLFAGPAAGDAAYVKAVSLINEKRYDEALAALRDAETVFGPHPDVITYQGYTWRKKGEFDRAEAYYRQALAIAPDHRGATEYYGELKVERGDLPGAKLLLARLDAICSFGCAEAEELRRWVDLGRAPQ